MSIFSVILGGSTVLLTDRNIQSTPASVWRKRNVIFLCPAVCWGWTGSNKVNFSSPEMRALFILCNFDRTPANFLIIFLSLLVAQPNITWPFPVISRNHEYTPDRSSGHTCRASGMSQVLCPQRQVPNGSALGALVFSFQVVRVAPHHQGSFLAVSVPLHLDQLPFPSLIFPFRVSSDLLWAGEQDDQSLSDLRSKIREHGVWMKACWVLLGVPCPKFVSPILAIWRHFILVWDSLCILPSGGYSVMLWLTIRMSSQELCSFFFFLKLVFILLRYTH